MQPFFVYILKCSDDSYYVGHTDDLEKRFSEHQNKKYCSYTSTRLPVQLIFQQTFESREAAFIVERRIKNWSRKKKEAWMEENPRLLTQYAKKQF
jgi:putative endonuclease